ncbi:MAG: hypothetical protein H0U97_01960 [Gammaproteobacteria bacterium]|nr:hypothetical protein [Gammaproteobacteria bacterium]
MRSSSIDERSARRGSGTGIEAPAIGDCMLVKVAQDPALRHDYQGAFAPD